MYTITAALTKQDLFYIQEATSQAATQCQVSPDEGIVAWPWHARIYGNDPSICAHTCDRELNNVFSVQLLLHIA